MSAAEWIVENCRYLFHSAAWPLAAYYSVTLILGMSGWAALLLAVGAWYAGVGFLREFEGRSPASYVSRSLPWISLHVLWLPCVLLIAVHFLTGTWPIIQSNLAAATAAVLTCLFQTRPYTIPLERHYRGARRLSQVPIRETERAYKNDSQAVRWGGILLPGKAITEHTAFVGETGSGKSLSIKLLLQQLLTLVQAGSDCRALIYDADQDMLPYLTALQRCHKPGTTSPFLDPHVPIITLNPYDTRAYAWDIAADVTSDATAIEVASMLFPLESNDQDKFFGPTAQQILRRVMMALHYTKPGQWTFKDLVDALQTEDSIRRTLESSPYTSMYAAAYLSTPSATGDDRQSRGIVATIGTKISVYEPIAALWEKAIIEGVIVGKRRRVSLKEWSEGAMVLLLGAYDARAATLNRINQVLFNLAAKYVLSQPPDPADHRRSFFILDEVRRVQKLEKLDDLLTNGRKRGACVIIGFQDIEGMRNAYQTQIAHEIIAQCSNIAFLKVSGETAKWAQEYIQSNESFVVGFSDSGQHVSMSESLQTRPLVLASELSALAKAGPKTGLEGWYRTAYVEGVYFHKYRWDEVIGTIVTPDMAGLSGDAGKGFIERSPADQQYYAPTPPPSQSAVTSPPAQQAQSGSVNPPAQQQPQSGGSSPPAPQPQSGVGNPPAQQPPISSGNPPTRQPPSSGGNPPGQPGQGGGGSSKRQRKSSGGSPTGQQTQSGGGSPPTQQPQSGSGNPTGQPSQTSGGKRKFRAPTTPP